MEDITLLQENDFSAQMNQKVIPFIEKRKTVHNVESVQGGPLHVETLLPDGNFHSVLVIFHGFCEYCAKYDEFSYYALQQGFAICRFDHRGHGFSPREKIIQGEPSKVHIEYFNTYVTDAHSVVEKIAKPLAKAKPVFLFAHSMGGAIGGVYLTKYTDDFTAAVLNSPMLQVYLMGLPQTIGILVVKILSVIKGPTAFNPAHRAFPFDLVLDEKKHSATSIERHSFFYQKRFPDERLHTWGGTMMWLYECLKAMKYLRQKKLVQKIKTQTILLQAEKDATVMPGGQNDFAKKAANVTLHVIKAANHEVFIGKNSFYLPWITQIFEFYENFV